MGVERQLKDTRRIIEEEGWKLVGPYDDNNRTAADPDKPRPEYDRMMADIRAGKIDVVVVAVSDRLHRQPLELEMFLADCRTAGMTRLRTDRSREYDLSDYDAIRDIRKEAIDAAFEVDRLKFRTRLGMLDLAERGKYSGGTRPFGYESDGVTVRESEASLVKEAASRILEGGTLYGIRKDWNERSVPTVTGKAWSVPALKQILTAPRVAGLRQHQGEVIGDAQWDAILPREDWERVRKVLTDPSRRQPRPSADYPLRGVLRCGECGGYLHAVFSRGTRSYACRKDNRGCGRVYINAENVERYVYSLALPLADSADLRDAVREEEEEEAESAQLLVLLIATDESRLRELAEMVADGDMDRANYTRQSKRLRGRIEEKTTRLAATRGRSALGLLGGEVQASWEQMSAEDKRLILLSLMDSITVRSAGKRGQRFNPDRVDILWRPDIVENRAVYFSDGVLQRWGGRVPGQGAVTVWGSNN